LLAWFIIKPSILFSYLKVKKNYIICNLCKLSRDKIQFLKCLKFVLKSSKPFPFFLCVPGSSARQSKEKEEKEDGKEEKKSLAPTPATLNVHLPFSPWPIKLSEAPPVAFFFVRHLIRSST
jgi:hypothetical protein